MRMARILAVNFIVLALLLALLEVAARFAVTYDPSYYTGIKRTDDCISYPYGEVCFNSEGFPDREFEQDASRPVVGYFGDSICFGVGAGDGHRLTDLLEQAYPAFQHRNYCYVGDAPLERRTMARHQELATGVDIVVLLMNLNDIGPLMAELPAVDAPGPRVGATPVSSAAAADDHRLERLLPRLKQAVYPVDQFLRGASYAYNYARSLVKNWLTVRGFEASGYRAVELWPGRHEELLAYTAARLNHLSQALTGRGKRFVLLLFPYEMQVSRDAEQRYRLLGIDWESGFEDGTTQELLAARLDPAVARFDLRRAFDDVRQTARVGEYFVFDAGDKIDWNHPNRKGHRKVFDYLRGRLFEEAGR